MSSSIPIDKEETKTSDPKSLKSLDTKSANPTLRDPKSPQLQAKSPKSTEKKKPAEPTIKPASYRQFFRFATGYDILLMTLGSLAALGTGVVMPLFTMFMGNFSSQISPVNSIDDVFESGKQSGLRFLYVGIGSFVVQLLTYCCWTITGARQSQRYQEEYFKAMLRQQISFFDTSNPNEFASKMSSEISQIEKGIGEKVSQLSSIVSLVATGFAIGYSAGWELSTLLIATTPILMIAAAIFMRGIRKVAIESVQVYSKSGGTAEQALGAMRTVASLTGENKEHSVYQAAMKNVRKTMIWLAAQGGVAFGLFWFTNRATYALGFWFGGNLISWNRYNVITQETWSVGNVLTVFFSVSIASGSIGFIVPSLKAVTEARTAAAKVLAVIDKKIDYSYQSAAGIKKDKLEGEIEFRNVEFTYPSRPISQILKGMSIKLLKNKKNAFVGESGCGKSTCMQLLERFYDPDFGSVLIDGVDIKEYNIAWLRSQIGYVGQEPVLFSRTIRENFKLSKPDATDDEIWAALREANAEEFVRGFEEGLDTYVGSGGAALSGGQKQRIAIARVILRNPRILLLDEATSALDRKNELKIQETLDKIAEGRTSIVIAHRLTTIQNADKICLFKDGVVAEEGTHQELVEKQGLYYELQKGQLAVKKDQQDENGAHSPNSPKSEDDIQVQMEKANDNEIQTEKEQAKQPLETKEVNLGTEADLLPKPLKRNTSKDSQPKQQLKKNPTTAQAPPAQAKIKKVKKKLRGLVKRLYQMNKPERGYYFLGVIFSMMDATIFPFFALVLANIMRTLAIPNNPNFKKDSDYYSLLFFILGLCSIVTYSLKQTFMSIAGEKLTERVRCITFEKMLRMHIGWFDDPKNLPGTLTARLAVDAASVNTLTTTAQSSVYQAFASLATGLAISFSASWALSLIALGAIPFFAIVAILATKSAMKSAQISTKALKESGQYLSEALCNIRTVAGLCAEDEFLKIYTSYAIKTCESSKKEGVIGGTLLGLKQFCLYGFFTLLFWVGTVFIVKEWIGYQDMFQATFGIMYSFFELINLGRSAGDIGRGYAAVGSLFEIIDGKSKIDYKEPTGNLKTPIIGNIEFKNVKFKYPTREKIIFDGLSFKINAKTKVALVGPSGCGKSTIMQLLLRFYDVDEGEILIDGKNIKEYDLHHLRDSFGFVSQEPFLFNGTVEENIK